MSKLRVGTIEPQSGTNLNLGASGDTVTVSSDSIKANTFKDAGGNTLWTSDGAGTVSSVNSAMSGGGVTFISETTVSSPAATVAFNLTGSYEEYMLVCTDVVNATDSQFFAFQCNTNNLKITSTYWQSYQEHGGAGQGAAQRTGMTQAGGTNWQLMSEECRNNAPPQSAGNWIINLFSPSNTTYLKHFNSTCSYTGRFSGSSWEANGFTAGIIWQTAALTSITVRFMANTSNSTGDNITSGHFALYGI